MSQIIDLISNFDPMQTLILIGIFLFAAIVKGFLALVCLPPQWRS